MTADDAEWDWNVAVFCRNEQPYIEACLHSIAAAIDGHRALVTVVVNGSSDQSASLAHDTARRLNLACDIFTIVHGDKSNAINRFYYDLRADARRYFFVDGYARVSRSAFSAMDVCLTNRDAVVAATGVASNGRTMRLATPAALASGGQLHGQLHGLRREFIDRIVARRLRLPIDLYRGDGLIASMAMHNLDPVHIAWDTTRIAALPEATYEIPSLSMFRVRDLKRQYSRKVRQMRGRLENLAIRSIVYQQGYEGLPEYADEMIRRYIEQHDLPRTSLPDRYFMNLALRQVRQWRQPDPANLAPRRLVDA